MQEKIKKKSPIKEVLAYYGIVLGVNILLLGLCFLTLWFSSLNEMINNPFYVEFSVDWKCVLASTLFSLFIIAAPILAYKFKRKTALVICLLYSHICVAAAVLFLISFFSADIGTVTAIWFRYVAFAVLLPYFGLFMKGAAVLPILSVIACYILSIVFMVKLKKNNVKSYLKTILSKKIKK